MQNNFDLSLPALTELIEQATNYITAHNYSEVTIKKITRTWGYFQEFADLHGERFFSIELAAKFMKETYGINDIYRPDPKTERWRVRHVWCLDDYSKKKCFAMYKFYNMTPIPEAFLEIHFLYVEYLINKNQKKSSILTKISRLKKLFLFLQKNEIIDTKEVTPTTILEFIKDLEFSTAYQNNILFTIRDFLKCPAVSEQFQDRLVNILNIIHVKRYERLPSFYSNEEVSKILLMINRNTLQGKKDYVIIILAVDLGLRVSDIRNLQLNEIKWDKNTIELFQQKTGEFLQLHMTKNVKWALLDYLMHVRPKDSKYNNVILRSRAPYTPHAEVACFYKCINKYINLAGIKTAGKHHGMHSCRYGLATRLMNEGVPITVVSEVLGHKFANVTKDYTRIDISRLRLVALEVPSHV